MKMKEYSTWYRSSSETKIKKKNDNLCNDKIPLVMILGCIYIHTYQSHVYIDLGETIGNID